MSTNEGRMTEMALASQIKHIREGAEEFAAEHGSCRVTVGPNSPVALAGVEQVAGYPVHADQLRLIGAGDDSTEIDGDLIYFRAIDDRVSALDVVRSVDWLSSWGDTVEFTSADWSQAEKSGRVYLEGRSGDLLVDATFQLVAYSVNEDWDGGDDDD